MKQWLRRFKWFKAIMDYDQLLKSHQELNILKEELQNPCGFRAKIMALEQRIKFLEKGINING